MKAVTLDRKVRALESRSSGRLINSWTAYALWNYDGRDPDAVWDPGFKKKIEELAEKSGCSI